MLVEEPLPMAVTTAETQVGAERAAARAEDQLIQATLRLRIDSKVALQELQVTITVAVKLLGLVLAPADLAERFKHLFVSDDSICSYLRSKL